MPSNNWGINFPDNPYEGQIFYYPHTQDTFTYVVPKNPYEGQIFYYPATKDTFTYIIPKGHPNDGQWVVISYDLFMKFKSSSN